MYSLYMKTTIFYSMYLIFCLAGMLKPDVIRAEQGREILLQIPAILSTVLSSATLYGDIHQGQYHLGPVDFAETEWHNACAPAGGYRTELQPDAGLGGEYLAGVSYQYSENGGACDRCIAITTAKKKTVTARVVTYGATNGPGDIDVSPSVFAALNLGEYPRSMTWQFVKCPPAGQVVYEFQTGANIWWSSLWVRNARIPIAKVEVKSKNHPSFFALQRGGDGTLTDNEGFGNGPFSLRITGVDGQVVEDTFSFLPTGQLVRSKEQFR